MTVCTSKIILKKKKEKKKEKGVVTKLKVLELPSTEWTHSGQGPCHYAKHGRSVKLW